VYPVFGHWAWGDGSLIGATDASLGWLRDIGFIDFAGSTVVHSVGGWAALAAIIVIGPRIGRFGEGAVAFRGHDLPVTTVGVFVLWIGWYGFNGGSEFALTDNVPSIIQNTTLAATFGGLVGMALTWRRDRRPDVVVIMNGSLAGLVAITASANIVSPAQAALIGAVGAGVMQIVSVGLERVRIDDAVGAVPVHLGAGVWGTLAVALFGDVDAFSEASNRLEQLGIQTLGIVICFVWAFGLVRLALGLINRHFPLRIDEEGELAGLNVAEHGASTEISDLLSDIDAQRRSGDFATPVRVEPHTEVGQIAAEYNRVLVEIGERTESLQLLRRTAAAANESSSIEAALAAALAEVCAYTGWPIGHAFLMSRDDPNLLVSTGIWHLSDEGRYGAFREATGSRPLRAGHGLPGMALEARRPVSISATDLYPVGLRAALAVPIIVGTEAVGVLEFVSDEPMDADEDVLQLLMSVGTQVGRVVERERSEEARLRTLIDNMPAGVYLRDLEGRFILVNREYEEFWGVSNDEIRGKTLAEAEPLSTVPMAPSINAAIDRATLSTGEPQQREARSMRDGKEHVLADVRFPVLDNAGQIVAIAGIDIDITEQKRNQAELAELLRRVETARDAAMEAASAKSRFLANMSHELRTPLNAIIGFTRLVSRNADGLAERQVVNLSKVLVSAEHLLVLIDEILDLSRIDAGGIAVERAEVDVAALVHEVTDSLEPLVDRPRVRMFAEVEDELPPVVTDRDKVRQVLLNLLSNAIKYTDQGSIEVRARVDDGRLRFDVSDTGLGIAPNELGPIFDEFHRADSASARARRGTGLGLAISRRIATALGGDISVASRLGEGSTFTFVLPLDPAAGASTTSTTSTTSSTSAATTGRDGG
jgi:PAS domain S-box-containing protein